MRTNLLKIPTEQLLETQPDIPFRSAPMFDLRTYDQSDFDRGRPGWYVLLWWLVQSVVFPLSLHSMSGLRCWVLRRFGATLGQGILIRPTARVTYPWKVTIGDYSWIGDDVVLYSLDRITLGDHVVISQKSYLCTGSHDFRTSSFDLATGEIQVGHGAWVAADCFVGPGVTVGDNVIVGARSTVFSSLPSAQVCWGSPCKPRYSRVT